FVARVFLILVPRRVLLCMHSCSLTVIISYGISTHLFFFNHAATTEIYTLSLHDALPIYQHPATKSDRKEGECFCVSWRFGWTERDRKSTRLNSSHVSISYAVFCLKKKSIDGDQYLLNSERGIGYEIWYIRIGQACQYRDV